MVKLTKYRAANNVASAKKTLHQFWEDGVENKTIKEDWEPYLAKHLKHRSCLRCEIQFETVTNERICKHCNAYNCDEMRFHKDVGFCG